MLIRRGNPLWLPESNSLSLWQCNVGWVEAQRKPTVVKKIPRIFKVIFRCPIPRYARYFTQQMQWFRARLPGHLVLIQIGNFWEISFSSCSYRFHHRNLEETKRVLWKSGLPVAWIYETGRQISGILERALTYRWALVESKALALGT